MLQDALSATRRVNDAVAERFAVPHQRASLAHIAQAARVRRDDDAAAGVAGRAYFGEAEAGDKRVHVHDVGANVGEPAMQMFGAPNRDIALRFRARGRGRDRIAEHIAAFVFVDARRRQPGFGRGNEHLMSARAKFSRHCRDIHFGAADAIGVIPAEGLHDLHRFRPLMVTSTG